jgi:acetyltransferase-like isoleucine patch superfamily enzyme
MLIAPVKVGDNSVTGAGSVVTKDVSPDTLVAGVPAKVKKDFKEQENENKSSETETA